MRWLQDTPSTHADKASGQPLDGITAVRLLSTAENIFRVQPAGPTWRLAARSALRVAAAAIETVQQLSAQVCTLSAAQASPCTMYDTSLSLIDRLLFTKTLKTFACCRLAWMWHRALQLNTSLFRSQASSGQMRLLLPCTLCSE